MRISVFVFIAFFSVAISELHKHDKNGGGAKPKTKAVSSIGEQEEEYDFSASLMENLQSYYENVVVSPLAIASSLSLYYAGAEGTTKREFAKLFGFDYKTPPIEIAKAFMKINEETSTEIGYRMWIDDYTAKHIVDKYEDLVEDFLCEIDLDDHSLALKAINEWVRDKTGRGNKTKYKKKMIHGLAKSSIRHMYTQNCFAKGNKHRRQKKCTLRRRIGFSHSQPLAKKTQIRAR